MNRLFIFLFLFIGTQLFSQEVDRRNFSDKPPAFLIKKTSEKIIPDGILNEKIWSESEIMENFSQKFPSDSIDALAPTQMMMAYDDDNLYVVTKCYSKGGDWIVPSLRRDYGFIATDNITLLFDTFKDKTNAFVFGMNARGVRREALVFNRGRNNSDFSDSWDNKWRGDAKTHGDHWIAEFVIPFNTIRFEEGATSWRFSAYRYDTQHNEISVFMQIPINFTLTDLNYMAEMNFEEPLKKTGLNVSVIPYLGGSVSRDFEDETQIGAIEKFSAGGDVKIGITSGLNLDLTVNPDFSQVEVDRQVTNLNRFELFFPERRQFFQENADLFSGISTGRSQPFFSRRIGITQDTATGEAIQNTILYGARLSGKINERTRIGLLNTQTAAQLDNDLPSFNYTVGVLQRNIGARSNISFIGINKQAINAKDFTGSFSKYNRVFGGDYNFSTKDNHWNGKFSQQFALTESSIKDKFSNHWFVEYSTRKFRAEIFSLYVGAGYDAEVGFVPRTDIYLVSPEGSLFFYPESSNISRHTLFFDTRFIYKVGNDPIDGIDPWTLSDVSLTAEWTMQFRNFASFSIEGNWSQILLFDDFDPTQIQEDGQALPGNENYSFGRAFTSFRSDRTKKISYGVRANYGQFYNGTRLGLSGDIRFRFQPYASISLDYSYNYIELAEPFVPVNLHLVRPRFDLTFSKKLFFTAFFQYNKQQDNLNVNARLQWRFQPASDFFLVYGDNYLTEDFSNLEVRNRAITAKFTYWLNL